MVKYQLPYSSATIRNEMNFLENYGYLEKTHISSGRVPSKEGYRFYVHNLGKVDLDEGTKNQVATIINKHRRNLNEEMLQMICCNASLLFLWMMDV